MIVFDLDGTLIDSARDLADAASALVQEFGGSPLATADVAGMVGDGAALLVSRALIAAGLDSATPGALERFMTIYERRLFDHTVAYDGIHEVLAQLMPRGPLAVLTNKPLSPAERILQHLGLRGFFSAVIGDDGSYPRKPDPSALRALAGDEPSIMVGDSPVDAATAAAAGCGFVLAAYGFGVARFDGRLPGGAFVARHPRELASLAETRTFDAARVPIVIR